MDSLQALRMLHASFSWQVPSYSTMLVHIKGVVNTSKYLEDFATPYINLIGLPQLSVTDRVP